MGFITATMFPAIPVMTCMPAAVQKPDEPEVCFGCHHDIRVAANKWSHHPIIEGKVTCTSCHSPHGSLSKHMVKADDSQELCYSCHADKRGPYIYEHPPVAENCLTCHTSHGSIHAKLLTEKVPNLCQDCHDWQRHPGTPYDAKTAFTGEVRATDFSLDPVSIVMGRFMAATPSKTMP